MSEPVSISLRQAVVADVDAVAELFDDYRQFYGQASNRTAARDFLLARANHGESVILVAEHDRGAVGFAQLYPAFSSVSLARIFILNDLYVRPAYRRCGVAKSLLASAEDHARKLHAVRLTLSTAVTNESAQALYNAAGWKQDWEFQVFHRAIQP